MKPGALAVVKGRTSAATPQLARRALGVEIGKDVARHVRHNSGATLAPTASDDTSAGYEAGSMWTDVVAGKSYIAHSVSAGAAVWKEVTLGGAVGNYSITGEKLADGAVTTFAVV